MKSIALDNKYYLCIRYTRAANRQPEAAVSAEQINSTYPILAYDPATAMYSPYPNAPLFYSALPHASAGQPVGLQPGLGVSGIPRMQATAIPGRPGFQQYALPTIAGIPQIGAAGVPLGIPGASSGMPATGAPGARTLSARGRFRPTGTNRTFAGRGYLNLGRGYASTSASELPVVGGELISQVCDDQSNQIHFHCIYV